MRGNFPVVLDCTFRDGGYYNSWDFDKDLVVDYLDAIEHTGIHYVELGFRSLNTGVFLGAHAYTSDAYLESLNIPECLKVSVMINAKEVVTYSGGPVRYINQLFDEKIKSKVDLVRIAAHGKEIEHIKPAILRLYELGYRVGLNIMQAGRYSDEELSSFAKMLAKQPVDVLYFADSLGNMETEDIIRVLEALKKEWSGPIGCHTHDNKGRAIQNSIVALDNGAVWIDATVNGMGRGPGNARLELLLPELNHVLGTSFELLKLMELSQKHFSPLQNKYGWGPNPLYFLSAVEGVHPTYVQEMLSDSRYTVADIVEAIKYLGQASGSSYSTENLENALSFSNGQGKGDWSVLNWASGRPVLIIAAGSSVQRHKSALLDFIHKHKPIVLSLNLDTVLDQDNIDAWLACHPTRIAMDASRYDEKQILMAPVESFPDSIAKKIKCQVRNYGMRVEPNVFRFGQFGCTVPRPLVAAYALALATSAGASKIYLAGFDGYVAGDQRQKEMTQVFEQYMNHKEAKQLIALTPTSYPVYQRSVYAHQDILEEINDETSDYYTSTI